MEFKSRDFSDARTVLTIRGLTVGLTGRPDADRVLGGIDLDIRAGETHCLVGESGSGKSVTSLAAMGLLPKDALEVTGGSIDLEGFEITKARPAQMRELRARRIAMIFQEPMTALNPVLRVGDQMAMAVRVHEKVSRKAAWARARAALDTVGIPAPDERLLSYPHQLSGGMRQRVAIATALLHGPAVIIADEPTTALDVSIQGQILAEVRRLADETGTAIVWITHDLAVVSSLADDICVMYAGRIVESGTAEEIIADPRHPYTRGLIQSVPSLHEPGRKLPQIPGSTPQLSHLPSGCAFRPRCPRATDLCATDPPDAGQGHRVNLCHHPLEAP